MQEIEIKVKCNWCEEYAPEDDDATLKDWSLDFPVTWGRNRTRLVDLCPLCAENIRHALYDEGREAIGSGREASGTTPTGRPRRTRTRTGNLQPGTFLCPEKGCDRVFTTEHGRGMHLQRTHRKPYYPRQGATT